MIFDIYIIHNTPFATGEIGSHCRKGEMKDGWVENRRDGVTPCPIVIVITHIDYDVSVRVRRCDWGVVL